MKSAIRDSCVATRVGRALWWRAGAIKRFAVDMVGNTVWRIESPGLYRRNYQSLRLAPHPLIIGGTGGSGTRVVARVAEAAGFYMGRQNLANDAISVVRYIDNWTEYIRRRCDGEDLGEEQQRQMDRDLALALIWHRRQMPDSKAPWGAKYPRLMYFLPHLHSHYSEMKLIHVVRDGRDMAFSPNQSQLDTLGNTYSFALRNRLAGAPRPVRSMVLWSESNCATENLAREILGNRYLCVRFEDLCNNPTSVVPTIFEFLEASAPDPQTTVRIVGNPPLTIGRWREQDQSLLDTIHKEGESGLRTFGYLES